MVVSIRTDQPQSEVGIWTPDGTPLSHYHWQAHRELSSTLLGAIRDELGKHHKTFQDITGVVVFRGPGSFTGLRIGITVANSLAYGLGVPIVGATGEQWISAGRQSLRDGHNDRLVVPEYGAEAHITPPRK